MKKLILILSLAATIPCLKAQTADSAGHAGRFRNMALDFSAGYSVPLGQYGSTDPNGAKTGWAAPGFLAQVTFHWMSKNSFGMAAQYTFQRNTMQDAAETIPIEGLDSIMLGPGQWTNHYLLVGPVFMKNFRRLYVDARLLGGAVLSLSPVFFTPDPADTTRQQYDENMAPGFAWHFSAGVGFAISKKLVIKGSVGLQGGWPVANKDHPAKLLGYEDYKDPVTGIIYQQPVYSAPAQYTVKRVITTFNPSLGLVYRF